MSSRQQRRQRKPQFGRQSAADPFAQFDLDLLVASQEIDVVADREWFLGHPGVTWRDRPASLLERAAQGLPPEARVYVVLLTGGRLGRVVYTPDIG